MTAETVLCATGHFGKYDTCRYCTAELARAGSELESLAGEGLATPTLWRSDSATLSRDVAHAILATVGEIVRSVRDGAYSASLGDTSYLTYADGWAAASNLAQLVAADAVGDLFSPPE